MRTSIYAFALTLASVFAVGCGSNSSGGGSTLAGYGVPTPVPTTTPTSNAGSSISATGASATLNITSEAAFDDYLGKVVNTPTNIKITINMNKVATYSSSTGGTDTSFGGRVTISFSDASGTNYADSFSSMLQSGPNTVSSQAQNNQYNLLTTGYPEMNGLPGYHGFFQGTTYCGGYPLSPGTVCGGQLFGGAVILVIDSLGFNADGSGPSTGSGSIWYKNIVGSFPMGPMPGTNCWFVSAGPYQCREWTSGSGVATKRSIYPDGSGGYQKLGTFNGLNLKAAFGGSI
jgi:hypothetical protein